VTGALQSNIRAHKVTANVNVMSEPRTPLLILSLSVSEHKVLRKDTDYVATLQLDFQ
jgi:hypothetical protein